MAIIIATHMITAARRYGSASDGRIISHISRTIGPSPAIVVMAASLRTRNAHATAPIASAIS